MKETKLSLQTPCPACDSKLHLKALGCTSCGLEIKGAISLSPLAQLDDEMTHFLMIFIHCGGKIGDVEKALGISYPTVKAKLAKLQKILSPANLETKAPTTKESVMEILAQLDAGKLDYHSALKKMRTLKEQLD